MSREKEEYDYSLKLNVVGDSQVGKTSLIMRFGDDEYTDSFISTVGLEFKYKTEEINGKIVKFQVFDTAKINLKKLEERESLRCSHGLIIVYDITNADTICNIKKWLKYRTSEDQPVILVGAKSDASDDRQVSVEEVQKIAETIPNCVGVIEVSSKTGLNVRETFRRIGKTIVRAFSDDEEYQNEQEIKENEVEAYSSENASEEISLGLLKLEIDKYFGNDGSYVNRGARDPQRDICLGEVKILIENPKNTFDDIIAGLHLIAQKAQAHHQNTSGTKFLGCGPLINKTCGFKKAVDEIVAVFSRQPAENTALLNNQTIRR